MGADEILVASADRSFSTWIALKGDPDWGYALPAPDHPPTLTKGSLLLVAAASGDPTDLLAIQRAGSPCQ